MNVLVKADAESFWTEVNSQHPSAIAVVQVEA